MLGNYIKFGDENVILKRRIHWKNYLSSAIFLAVAVILLIVRMCLPDISVFDTGLETAGEYTEEMETPSTNILYGLEVIFLGCMILFFTYRIITVSSVLYYVTSKRIIAVYGFFAITTKEMLLDRCEVVNVRQGVYDRMFGCGDIYCRSAGSEITLEDVPKPEELKNIILEAVSKTRK